MKKLRFLLAIVVVFSLISTFVFAADFSVVLNDVEYNGSDVTLTVSLSKNIGTSVKITLGGYLTYDTDVWEIKTLDGFLTDEGVDGIGIAMMDDALTDGITVGTIVFSVKDGADVANSKKFGFSELYDGDDNDVSYTGGNVTVKKTDVVVEPQANKDVEGYTDVINFVSSAKATSGTTLSFDLYENDSLHKNYSVNLGDWGLIIEEGTINFKVAIIGAPATGVTLRNPVVK